MIQEEADAWDEFYRFWHSIISLPDEKTFDERLQQFESQYATDYLQEVGYIKATWLEPYKEKLVKAWVDRHLHFGNVVTSRVEGIILYSILLVSQSVTTPTSLTRLSIGRA